MGIFDMVFAPCPHCGKPVEFQSKAAEMPYMNHYTLENAPTEILVDILNSPEHCMSCGGWLVLIDPDFPPEPRRPKPTISKVRTPENPKTHFQGFKWWPDNEPFTYADITDNAHR